MIVLLLITLLFAGFIAYLSLASGDSKAVRWMPDWLQNLGHFGCYAILAFLLAVTLVFFIRDNPFLRGVVAFALATGYGLLMEYLQRKRPGRSGRLSDAAIDAAGAVLGVLAALTSH